MTLIRVEAPELRQGTLKASLSLPPKSPYAGGTQIGRALLLSTLRVPRKLEVKTEVSPTRPNARTSGTRATGSAQVRDRAGTVLRLPPLRLTRSSGCEAE